MRSRRGQVSKRSKGTLILIGGHEDREGERTILKEIAERARAGGGGLAVVTMATLYHQEAADRYSSVFTELGVRNVVVLGLRSRRDAYDEALAQKLSEVSVVFFTGGDQLRITSQMGYTPVLRRIRRLYEEEGATVAGTSAGAAAMAETMLIGGAGYETNEISAIGMAPGLGLISRVVIDSHFAERGRFGRLLGAVAQNPRNLGLGIDEDTAIVIDPGEPFRVIGRGAVYVLDGSEVSYSSLSEENPEGIVSIFDVKLHVLRKNDGYDLTTRRPIVSRR